MSTIKEVVRQTKQPRGGFINPSTMGIIDLADGKELSENENLNAEIVERVVDNLTRYRLGVSKEEAFRVSIEGAKIADRLVSKKSLESVMMYIKWIEGLDACSIENACKAVTYDIWTKNSLGSLTTKSDKEINPNLDTLKNIKILVERKEKLVGLYGPIIKEGFSFEPTIKNNIAKQKMEQGKGNYGGYSRKVTSGLGEYLTEDTIWVCKSAKQIPSINDTLELLIYYIMGKHSCRKEFKNVSKIGIYNTRLNKIWWLDMRYCPNDLIVYIESSVIGY